MYLMKPREGKLNILAPVIITAFIGAVSLGVGIVGAAQISVPGSPLYGVKEAIREFKLSASFGEVARTRTELSISLEKAKEIQEMEKRGFDPESIRDAALNLVERQETRPSMADRVLENKETLQSSFENYIEKEQVVLTEVRERVPEPAKQAIDKAIDNSKKGFRKSSARGN